MDLIITHHKKEKDSQEVELTNGKKTAYIRENKSLGYINVICKNASHKAWRGMGRHFYGGWEEALKGYKSSDMKAMISFARESFDN